MNTDNVPALQKASTSLVVRFASRFGVEPQRMMQTLKATCFKTEEPATDEQMMSLLIVAEQFNLNPFTRELFAFVDKKSGGIVPYVSVDGWARIINEHPQFDGMEFDGDATGVRCIMYRKDRAHPISVTEYMAECKRGSSAWSLTPRRMLRHRAMTQCARYAFGFAIYDEDEARQVVQMGRVDTEPVSASAAAVRGLLGTRGQASSGEETGSSAAATPAPIVLPIVLPIEEQPEVEPPPRTLASWMAEVLDADDEFTAELVLAEAKALLSTSDHAELAKACKTKWQQPPQE